MGVSLRGGFTRRRVVLAVLSLLAVPGLLLLVRDLVVTSPEDVAERMRSLVPLARVEAARRDLAPELVLAVIAVESKGDPEARSSKGALGLMQLLLPTAREQAALLGDPEPDEDDLLDPETNVRLGAAYLARQVERFGGSERLGLAAYHAGPGRVNEWIRSWPGRSPEEVLDRAAFPATRSYVDSVLEYRERFRSPPDDTRR